MYNYHTDSSFENNLTAYTYPQNNERMNISFFQYFSTFSLMTMCYSFINPNFIRNTSLYLALRFANTFLSGFIFLNDYVYTPYKKYIRKPLYCILNISDKTDEIQIIKDGVIIYSFKTMNDFIKNNPFEFVPEYSDDETDETDEEEDTSDDANKPAACDADKQETEQPQPQPHNPPDIDTLVDADLTNASVNIHEKTENSDNEVDSDNTDDEDEDDEDEDDDEDSTADHILDPSEYDFIIQTLYYETNEQGVVNTHSYCLKYDTFFKSDLKTTYTHEELSKDVSSRKFIGSNLTFKGVKYNINLTTPNNYYVVNNSILDYAFLKWYMAENYDVILTKRYSISCIDNFVEMYTIKPGQKIVVEMNSLRVVEDESFVNSDSESGSGSGSDVESDSHESNTETENQTDVHEEITNSCDTNDVEILERCD
jgi:hypothetical protein